jgi:hypothetical protein
MTSHYALLSLIYMMSFVILFDRVHHKRRLNAWLSGAMMTGAELERLMAIWTACQEK